MRYYFLVKKKIAREPSILMLPSNGYCHTGAAIIFRARSRWGNVIDRRVRHHVAFPAAEICGNFSTAKPTAKAARRSLFFCRWTYSSKPVVGLVIFRAALNAALPSRSDVAQCAWRSLLTPRCQQTVRSILLPDVPAH